MWLQSEEIAETIAKLWKDPERARLAGDKGRKAVIEKYHFEILVKEMGALYQELLLSR